MPDRLTLHSTLELVRLRRLLQQASSLSSDLSESGRHVALIALDGSCEYAMWVASHHLGLAMKPEARFHDSLNGLSQKLGRDWTSSTENRRAVVQMHTARNQAQHAGSLPDPALVPDWTGATEAFVKSLVYAAYGVDLDTVHLSIAIANDALRVGLTAAEQALESGDADRAFNAAWETFMDARRRWRGQQEDAYGFFPLQSNLDEDPKHWSNSSRVADYGDVGVFATDLSEYHWLVATRRRQIDGVAPLAEDASRAIGFVFGWVMRWQAFDVRYPAERWVRMHEALEPPRVGPGRDPRILSVTPGTVWTGDQPRIPLTVIVANIPDRGRGTWGEDFEGALVDQLQEHGLDSRDVLFGGLNPLSGSLMCHARLGLDGERVRLAIRGSIRRCTETWHERAAARDEYRTRAAAAAERVRTSLDPSNASVLGAVVPSWKVEAAGDRLWIEFAGASDPRTATLLTDVLRSKRFEVQVDPRRGVPSVAFDNEFTDDEPARFAEAIDAWRSQLDHEYEISAAHQRATERLAREVASDADSHPGASGTTEASGGE